MGGDEFVVVLGGVNQAQGAQLVADRLHAAFNEPFDVSGQEVFVSLSIGVATSGPHTEHGEELLHDADTAMYRAKALGPARTEFYTVDMRSDARVQLQADTDLRRAFERREFDVWYQPIVALETGRTATLEALLRWREGNRTLVGTGELVSMAERMGLIVPIGYWVLERACADMAKWSRCVARDEARRRVGEPVGEAARRSRPRHDARGDRGPGRRGARTRGIRADRKLRDDRPRGRAGHAGSAARTWVPPEHRRLRDRALVAQLRAPASRPSL